MIPLEQLKESSVYQHILQEGRDVGRAEGELKGRVEGRIEEVRKVLIKQIAKRFPALDLQTEINSIEDLSTLEDLCLSVIDALHEAEMKQWVMEKMENK